MAYVGRHRLKRPEVQRAQEKQCGCLQGVALSATNVLEARDRGAGYERELWDRGRCRCLLFVCQCCIISLSFSLVTMGLATPALCLQRLVCPSEPSCCSNMACESSAWANRSSYCWTFNVVQSLGAVCFVVMIQHVSCLIKMRARARMDSTVELYSPWRVPGPT